MFDLSSKNLSKLLSKKKGKNLVRLLNSIPLYLRVLLYRSLGRHRVVHRKSDNRIMLVIHLGLGDFFNMLPAIKHLARSNKEVYVLVKRGYKTELERFISENNIVLKPIEDEERLDDYYRLNTGKLRRKYPTLELATTGKFSGKFSFFYPISYYIELGIDPAVAFNEKLVLEISSLRAEARELLARIDGQFIFTHLRASDFETALPPQYVDRSTLILDPFRNRNTVDSENYRIAQTYLSLNLNLIGHLCFMTRSRECYLIDSSFFNFLAHTDYKGRATVFMRSLYFHTLDEHLLANFNVISDWQETHFSDMGNG